MADEQENPPRPEPDSAGQCPATSVPPLLKLEPPLLPTPDPLQNIRPTGAMSGALTTLPPIIATEHVLLELSHIKASDVPMGGFLSLYVTNQRLLMVKHMGSGGAIAATLAAGIVGAALVSGAADRKAEKLNAEAKSVEQLLASSPHNYEIRYSDMSEIVMKRIALPLGYSRLNVRSRLRNVSFAFKRSEYEKLTGLLQSVLPRHVTLK